MMRRSIANGTLEWKHRALRGVANGYESVIPSLQVCTPETFKNMTEDERDRCVDKVLAIIRSINIYPIWYFSPEEVVKEIQRCCAETPLPYSDAIYSSTGRSLLDFMFPSIHLAEAGNSKNNCMYDRFYDDAKLKRCLYRYLKMYKFNNVRTMFFMYGKFFWQTPTNFSPMLAKSIYTAFCKEGDTVYDSSCGFGSRLLGAASSGLSLKYVGCEPQVYTNNSLHKLTKLLVEHTSLKEATTYLIGSESLILPSESVDFAFTCPPYFALERYDYSDMQSIVKYPKYQDWLAGYALPTIVHTFNMLKTGSYYVVCLGNVYVLNKLITLKEDWIRLCEDSGLVLQRRVPVKGRTRKLKDNAEELLIFRKETL